MKQKNKPLMLAIFTAAYNIIEGVVSIVAGSIAKSSSLVGFGVDSFIESLSAFVMIWRFTGVDKITKEKEEEIEQKAVKLVAISFLILGLYVLFESVKSLYLREAPEPSLIGIIISILSIIIMPTLFLAKNKTGKKINSKSLIADSKQTFACLMLSFSLLVGLSLNYFLGLWWADPVAGIIIAILVFREGYKTWNEKDLCEC
ncbi:MAG: cation transporter [Patescibacteria group bacterium]|nr:cation transporter [Patescibacteria group bacterium]MCL5093671.1 cation transporter [Patescibacteria group bacterium]